MANFVQNTANLNTDTLIICHFKDTNNVLGFGANLWIKGYLQYQNLYNGQWDLGGEGVFLTSSGSPYFVKISGSGTGPFTSNITPLAQKRIVTGNTGNLTFKTTKQQYIVSASSLGMKTIEHLNVSCYANQNDCVAFDNAYLPEIKAYSINSSNIQWAIVYKSSVQASIRVFYEAIGT